MSKLADQILADVHADMDWEKADKGAILELLSANGEQGEATHYYVLIKPSRYAEYVHNLANSIPFDLDDYGQVLEKGAGAMPNADQQAFMALAGGIDHAYIGRNQKEIESIIADFKKDLGVSS